MVLDHGHECYNAHESQDSRQCLCSARLSLMPDIASALAMTFGVLLSCSCSVLIPLTNHYHTITCFVFLFGYDST